MANSTYGNTIYCDTAGILSQGPLIIRGILYVPHAITDVIDLNFWDEANPTASSNLFMTATASSGTVTNDDTAADVLTSAAFPATSVVKVIKGSGSATYHRYHLIGTAGNDDRFIIDGSTWGDETSKTYEIISYPARAFFNATCTGITNDFSSQYYPLGGVRVENLICETITSGAYAIIYFD
jgi:hypothetical protein